MKLPLAAYADLPEQAPRKRAYVITYFSHVVGEQVTLRHSVNRFKVLAEAVAAAERMDPRLNPQIILVEDTP